MTLRQWEAIEKVRRLALADDRLGAVLMYGSFIKGEGDQYSDVEFYLFYRQDFPHRAWVEQIAPVELFFPNEHGTEVAVFGDLMRGEFHFLPEAEMTVVKTWEGLTTFEYAEKMNLVDKGGRLTAILDSLSRTRPSHQDPAHRKGLAEALINNLIQSGNLIKRGEMAHAHHCFSAVLASLVRLIRLADRADNHWESPTKKLEAEISPAWYEQYVECAPEARPESLRRAYGRAVELGLKLGRELELPDDLIRLLKRLRGSDFAPPRG